MKFLKYSILIGFVAVMLIISCSEPAYIRPNCKAKFYNPDQTHYVVRPNETTKQNIEVDDSGLSINLKMIDRLTNEVESCLIEKFGSPIVLDKEIVQQAQCRSNSFDLPLPRQCLVVKVAPDWFVSQYEYGGSKHQLIPYTNGGICTDKGVPVQTCYYRAGLQDDFTIVVPPSFYLYKDPLVRIVTGCLNPWNNPQLSECMFPTTKPLDNGSQN